MSSVVVVGNPKPASRTLEAAIRVARDLVGREPDAVVDVITLGPGLIVFGDQAVAEAIKTVRNARVLVVGSPTFKAAYSGLLKMFLDQFPTDGLLGVTAFPMMMGAGAAHALAPELLLKPVLSEMGASCPAPGLYVGEQTTNDDPRYLGWLKRAKAVLPASR